MKSINFENSSCVRRAWISTFSLPLYPPVTLYLATTNGVPTLDHLIKMLKLQKNKKVHLVPFNAEANSSMRSEGVKKLQQAGYKVTMETRTLMDQEVISRLFEQHTRDAEQFRRLTPKEQKLITR